MAAVSPLKTTKFSPADWHLGNAVMASTAQRQRVAAHDVRQQSKQLRDLTDSQTRWTQHCMTSSITSRIGDIQNWRETLEKTLRDTEGEIDKLTEHKGRAELALEAKSMPLEVVVECLAVREQREAIDRVRDEVEAELRKEFEVIESIRGLLHQRVQEAFEQICVLQDCHQQLHIDLQDKYTALQIDSACVELANASDTIAFQTDPTRIKRGIVSPDQWQSYSAHNVARAETEISGSLRLREALNQTIQQTSSDLEAQWTATAYALRKRLHEVEQARQELQWQQKNTETEMAEVEKEIRELECALAEKTPPMMVVQTRLDNRTYRPNVELCRDPPQYGMVEEVAEISGSQHALGEKLAVAEHAHGSLKRTLARIGQDLALKEASLGLDRLCEETRKKLSAHPRAHELAQAGRMAPVEAAPVEAAPVVGGSGHSQ